MPKEYAHLLTIIDNRNKVNQQGTGTMDSLSVLVPTAILDQLVQRIVMVVQDELDRGRSHGRASGR